MNAIEKILKAIGRRVSFQYPGDEGKKIGVLKDRIVIESWPASSGVPYWDVIDLIEFPDEQEPHWIRIGYYRKPKDRLVWGSQTTITEPIKIWKKLLIKAVKEKYWFRDLLEDVIKTVNSDTQQYK